jgi:hypothetical protein
MHSEGNSRATISRARMQSDTLLRDGSRKLTSGPLVSLCLRTATGLLQKLLGLTKRESDHLSGGPLQIALFRMAVGIIAPFRFIGLFHLSRNRI